MGADVKFAHLPIKNRCANIGGKMKFRLWICGECGTVKAFEDSVFEPIGKAAEQAPTCDAHSVQWPHGVFPRSVTMLKSDSIVEVQGIT